MIYSNHISSSLALPLSPVSEPFENPSSPITEDPIAKFSYLNKKMAIGIVLTVTAVALAAFIVLSALAWAGISIPAISTLVASASQLSAWSNAVLLASEMILGTLMIVSAVYGIKSINQGVKKPAELIPIEIFAKEILSSYHKKQSEAAAISSLTAALIPLFVTVIHQNNESINFTAIDVKALQIIALRSGHFSFETSKDYFIEYGFPEEGPYALAQAFRKYDPGGDFSSDRLSPSLAALMIYKDCHVIANFILGESFKNYQNAKSDSIREEYFTPLRNLNVFNWLNDNDNVMESTGNTIKEILSVFKNFAVRRQETSVKGIFTLILDVLYSKPKLKSLCTDKLIETFAQE